MNPTPITDRLPREADAVKPFGLVMIWLGQWGWQNCHWRDVKRGQGWAHGTVKEPAPARAEPKKGAWF